jgi:hypothetical protein
MLTLLGAARDSHRRHELTVAFRGSGQLPLGFPRWCSELGFRHPDTPFVHTAAGSLPTAADVDVAEPERSLIASHQARSERAMLTGAVRLASLVARAP